MLNLAGSDTLSYADRTHRLNTTASVYTYIYWYFRHDLWYQIVTLKLGCKTDSSRHAASLHSLEPIIYMTSSPENPKSSNTFVQLCGHESGTSSLLFRWRHVSFIPRCLQTSQLLTSIEGSSMKRTDGRSSPAG